MICRLLNRFLNKRQSKPSLSVQTQPQQPAVVPPQQGPVPPFVITLTMTQDLDSIWAENGRAFVQLPSGTQLWHGGQISPNNPALDIRGLWLTKNQAKKNLYNNWALQEANKTGMSSYLTEYKTNTGLQLADFGSRSMRNFTIDHCGSNHTIMKRALMAWLTQNNFDGIISINGDHDEVVIRLPAAVLDISSQLMI